MTTAAALLILHKRGWRVLGVGDDGGLRLRPSPGEGPNTPDLREPLATLRAHREEAAALFAWPPASWEAACRFGQADALLYPFLRPWPCKGEDAPDPSILTPKGPAALLQVLGGWAVTLHPGADGLRRWRISDVRPLAAAPGHRRSS